jgi:calcium/calmodulin-dependent protein kinase I
LNHPQSENFFPPPGSTSFTCPPTSKPATTTTSGDKIATDPEQKKASLSETDSPLPKQQQNQQQKEQHQSQEITTTTTTTSSKTSSADPKVVAPKKKKAEYVPPSPIISEEATTKTVSASAIASRKRTSSSSGGAGAGAVSSTGTTSGANGNSIGSGADLNDEGLDIVGQLGTGERPSYPPLADDEEEEYHGELHLYNNDLDNAISVLTTDPDLHSEIPVQNSPNKKGSKASVSSKFNNSTNSTNMSDLLAKPYAYPDDSPDPSSASGMRFDELYRLKGVLGTGAFSTVREGFHRSNADISYAVKCINRKKLSEEDEAALLDEVSILKEMKHPHIIRLFDFFTEPSTYYLVMERMRGGELFDRIVAKAYYNEKEARDTCKLILQAVEYCHHHNVAHRDLKPENLLLLSDIDDSAVKIADFGFAKKVYEPNSLTTQCGTPGYVAPEILEGTAYDERADMWSVGVILYILLGGYPPFIESTQRDLFRKIRKGEYEFHEEYWGTVSQDAKTLISSLLTVSAAERLTAKAALLNPWILGDDSRLASRDLGANLDKLRNFNAKRKFRAAVSTVIAVNKLNFGFVGKEFFSGNNNDDELVQEENLGKD